MEFFSGALETHICMKILSFDILSLCRTIIDSPRLLNIFQVVQSSYYRPRKATALFYCARSGAIIVEPEPELGTTGATKIDPQSQKPIFSKFGSQSYGQNHIFADWSWSQVQSSTKVADIARIRSRNFFFWKESESEPNFSIGWSQSQSQLQRYTMSDQLHKTAKGQI